MPDFLRLLSLAFFLEMEKNRLTEKPFRLPPSAGLAGRDSDFALASVSRLKFVGFILVVGGVGAKIYQN